MSTLMLDRFNAQPGRRLLEAGAVHESELPQRYAETAIGQTNDHRVVLSRVRLEVELLGRSPMTDRLT
jgi:hypothetical protein